MARQEPAQENAGQSNWFQDWSQRTPLVARSLIIVIIGGALVGFLAGLTMSLAMIPYAVIANFEVWRLVTYAFFDDGMLKLLFVMMSMTTQAPKMEIRVGSAAMCATVTSLIFFSALMFVAITGLVAFNPLYSDPLALSMPMTGFWPIMLGLITIECYSNPTGSRPCLCLTTKIPNRVYPFLMIAVFALIGGGVPYDLLSGALVGVIMTSKRLPFPCAPPSDAVAERLERGVLRAVADAPGFVSRSAAADGAAFTATPPADGGGAQGGGGWGAATASGQGGGTASSSGGGRRGGVATLGSLSQGGGAGASASAPGAGAGGSGGASGKASKFAGSARTMGSKTATTVDAPQPSAPPAGMSAREQARQARLAIMAAAEDSPTDAEPLLAELGVLESMGFDKERASEALRMCNGDVARASHMLSEESV